MRKNQIRHWMAMALAVSLFQGCASLDQDARINFLEGQMKDVLQKSAEWDVTSKNVRTRMADFGAQMDTLRDDMQRMVGNLEEMQSGSMPRENPIFSQQATAEEIRDLKERIQILEARITELEKGFPGSEPTSLIVPPEGAPSVASPATGLPTVSKPALSPPGGEPKPVPAQPKDQLAYNGAMDALKQKQYEKATRLFRTFIKDNPGHELNDNAQYWIGEAYYAQKKYEEAIIEFEEVIQRYPKGDKVPAALLKEGLAFHELKDNAYAQQMLKKLVDLYPETEEAKLAAQKLKEL